MYSHVICKTKGYRRDHMYVIVVVIQLFCNSNGKIRVPEKIRLRAENLLKLKFEKFSFTWKDGML